MVQVGSKYYSYGVNAFSSISQALSKVSSGGTILLADLSYTGDITIDKPVTIASAKGKTYINGTIAISCNGVTLQGLEILYNRTSKMDSAIVLRSGVTESGINISGCKLTDCGKNKDVPAIKK